MQSIHSVFVATNVQEMKADVLPQSVNKNMPMEQFSSGAVPSGAC